MDSLGKMLHRARMARGLSLAEVAALTRINVEYLRALEQDDKDRLPGGFFYKSFARQYAAALAAHDPRLMGEVDRTLASHTPPAEENVLEQMAAAPPPRMPQVYAQRFQQNPTIMYSVFLFFAVLGCTGFYSWWYKAQQAEASGTVVHSAQVAVQHRPVQQAKAQAVPVKDVSARVEQPETAAVLTSDGGEPAAASPIALNITAKEDTWFSLTSDGKQVFAGTLHPGESRQFAANANAHMRVGNAGGIDLTFNGKPVGAVGPRAQIRNVIFTPTAYQVVVPPPPAPEDEPDTAGAQN